MSAKVSTGPAASGRVRRSTVRIRAASSSRPNGLVAAAMAGTSGRPRVRPATPADPDRCPPPFWLHKGHKGHKGQVTITIKGKAYLKARAYLLKHRHGKPAHPTHPRPAVPGG